MIRIAAVPAHIDLDEFSRWLDGQGVAHEIVQEEGHQVLMIEGEQLRDPVRNALEQYLDDPRHYPDQASRPRRRSAVVGGHWQASPKEASLVFGLIVVAGIVAWLSAFGAREQLVVLLTIVNPLEWPVSTFDQRLDALIGTVMSGQVWRLLTPDILHFSLMHIIFNAVMLWYLGSQIEVLDGKKHFIGLFLVSSLTANIPQFLISGPLFGGLSGVVYGVLGYVWVVNQLARPRFQFPQALMTVAIVWLLIGFTPLTEALLGASMANAAHLGGLIGGLGYGVLVSMAPRGGEE